jgi:hypothetical protein
MNCLYPHRRPMLVAWMVALGWQNDVLGGARGASVVITRCFLQNALSCLSIASTTTCSKDR